MEFGIGNPGKLRPVKRDQLLQMLGKIILTGARKIEDAIGQIGRNGCDRFVKNGWHIGTSRDIGLKDGLLIGQEEVDAGRGEGMPHDCPKSRGSVRPVDIGQKFIGDKAVKTPAAVMELAVSIVIGTVVPAGIPAAAIHKILINNDDDCLRHLVVNLQHGLGECGMSSSNVKITG